MGALVQGKSWGGPAYATSYLGCASQGFGKSVRQIYGHKNMGGNFQL